MTSTEPADPARVDLDLDQIEEAFAHLASSATSRPYGPLGACPYCVKAIEAGPALVAEVRRLRENQWPEWSQVLTNQSCENGKHADWFVDSEHNHRCPWCERDAARAETERLRERINGQAETISKLGQVAAEARRVMEALQAHGASIVGHLLDTDDNAGERLRVLLREVSEWALNGTTASTPLRAEIERLRAEVGRVREALQAEETRVEYGRQIGEDWVPEHRGIKYATHQRTVHFRVDEPVPIDHWTYTDHRHPVEGCTHYRHDLTTQAALDAALDGSE